MIWLEFVFIFVVLPLLVFLLEVKSPLILTPVWLLALLGAFWMLKHGYLTRRGLWYGPRKRLERVVLKKVLNRFVISATTLLALSILFLNDYLYLFPAEHPWVYLLILVLYPLVSVYPQELLYRGFFYHRYGSFFRSTRVWYLVNALCFAWMHIVFENVIALVLAFIGGLYFANTYAHSRSLRLVWLEHTLYGILLFTVGLGDFFVTKRFWDQIG